MEFHILNRLADVNRELGPLLKTLGLKPKLRREDYGMSIGFENDQGDFSHIKLRVGRDTITGKSNPPWSGSSAEIVGYCRNIIGHNGWTYHSFEGTPGYLNFKDGEKRVFAALRKEIREIGAICVGSNRERYTNDEDFAEAFDEIARALGPNPSTEILCVRVDGAECYEFTDPAGQDWCIAFEEKRAVAYRQGEKLSSFPSRSGSAIGRFLKKAIQEVATGPAP
jgi:hypothetical protein